MTPDFLRGGGEMGALMRAHDWSRSSLGPPSGWPQSLRTVVRIMLNTGHPTYVWWGPEGACLYNDAYRESIGPERHPASLGRPAREVWEEIWPIIGPQIEQVRSGQGATWHVNHLVPITRHGRRDDVYWTYSYSPIDDETAPNGIGGVLVLCTETTEQVELAQRLAAQRDQLEQLFQQAPSFMASLNGPDHVFEIANPRYLQLVGRPVLGRTVAEALPDAVSQGYLRLLDEVYASGKAYTATGAMYSNQVESGGPVTERYVDFVYQPIKDSVGHVTGIFVEGVDVTERTHAAAALKASDAQHRQLSAELARTNQLKDEFLATLAHELRNPLAPIRNALAVLRRSKGDPRILSTSMDIMDRQVAQMVRLIDDLLDLSRLNRGIAELRREPITLGSILAEAVETSRPHIEHHHHRLTLEVRDQDLLLDADRTRMVQVFANLLNNAAKFTPKGGHLKLRAVRESGAVVVSVIDNGIGIAPDMLPRIFDMFTQVERSYVASAGGLGIGLTLVRQLVELHGGRVEALSAGLGRGSEFRVWLPTVEIAAASKETAGSVVAHAATAARRILIADDNVDSAASLAMALELAGHKVVIAHDGEQAIAAARKFRPDVMIADIGMPIADGHVVGRTVRAESWGQSVLLIALSGWGQKEDVRRSNDSGFDHHFVKPVDFVELEQWLAKHVEQRRT